MSTGGVHLECDFLGLGFGVWPRLFGGVKTPSDTTCQSKEDKINLPLAGQIQVHPNRLLEGKRKTTQKPEGWNGKKVGHEVIERSKRKEEKVQKTNP